MALEIISRSSSCTYVAQAIAGLEQPLESVGYQTIDQILPAIPRGALPQDDFSEDSPLEPEDQPDLQRVGMAGGHTMAVRDGTLPGLVGHVVEEFLVGNAVPEVQPLEAVDQDIREPSVTASSSSGRMAESQDETSWTLLEPPPKRPRGG